MGSFRRQYDRLSPLIYSNSQFLNYIIQISSIIQEMENDVSFAASTAHFQSQSSTASVTDGSEFLKIENADLKTELKKQQEKSKSLEEENKQMEALKEENKKIKGKMEEQEKKIKILEDKFKLLGPNK